MQGTQGYVGNPGAPGNDGHPVSIAPVPMCMDFTICIIHRDPGDLQAPMGSQDQMEEELENSLHLFFHLSKTLFCFIGMGRTKRRPWKIWTKRR